MSFFAEMTDKYADIAFGSDYHYCPLCDGVTKYVFCETCQEAMVCQGCLEAYGCDMAAECHLD